MKNIETKNGKIFYHADAQNMRARAEPAVIFLHGLSSNHTTWLGTAQSIRNAGFKVIAPDLRGHGFSDKTKKKALYDFPVFSEDLKQIMDQEGVLKSVLVGYSFGGSVAVDFAGTYSERVSGLILISANHNHPMRYKKLGFFESAASALLDFLAGCVLWQKRKKYIYYEHKKSSGYWESVWVGLNTMPLAINFWMLSNSIIVDLAEKIKNIKAPTLIVRGEKDFFFTSREAEDMQRAIPDSKLFISSANGHFLASASQEEVLGLIKTFLKNHENSNI